MKRFIALFLGIPAPWAVAAVFVVPALETALILGLMLPGELTVVLGGVLAARGRAPLLAIIAAAVAGPITGDVIGYRLGRRYGQEIVQRRLGGKWDRAHRWLSKKGGGTVFLGRFLPFLRSVMPATAGAMGMPARRFLPWDLCAAVVWGVASTLLGYFAGRDFRHVLELLNRFSLLLLALAIVVATLVIWRRKKRRSAA